MDYHDLTTFLTARLGEIELEAKHGTTHHDGCDRARCDCKVPEYLLTDIEAKRQMIDYALEQDDKGDQDGRLLALLALPFAWHRDYRAEWKP